MTSSPCSSSHEEQLSPNTSNQYIAYQSPESSSLHYEHSMEPIAANKENFPHPIYYAPTDASYGNGENVYGGFQNGISSNAISLSQDYYAQQRKLPSSVT